MSSWPRDAPLPSDTIIAAAGGDDRAVDLLCRSFRPLIRHVALRVPAAYREDAEDEILLELLESLASYRPFREEPSRFATGLGAQFTLCATSWCEKSQLTIGPGRSTWCRVQDKHRPQRMWYPEKPARMAVRSATGSAWGRRPSVSR